MKKLRIIDLSIPTEESPSDLSPVKVTRETHEQSASQHDDSPAYG